jgi:hypothetical protein
MCDMLRSCYTSFMWFDAAQTVGQAVQWYWCPDGALPLDVPNSFTSQVWDEVHWYNPAAGEDAFVPKVYSKGMLPGPFTGKGGVCGQLDWFAEGSPPDAPPLPRTTGGLPSCCFGGDLAGAYDLEYSSAWDRLRPI